MINREPTASMKPPIISDHEGVSPLHVGGETVNLSVLYFQRRVADRASRRQLAAGQLRSTTLPRLVSSKFRLNCGVTETETTMVC